jgi:PilZ domain
VSSQLFKTENLVPTTSQQRQAPRIRIQIPVFLRGTDALGAGFIELTKTLNISSSGACIASSHLLQLEQVIQLTIPTPSPSSDLVPHETPPISARVRRQESAGDLRLFGLEFLRPLS